MSGGASGAVVRPAVSGVFISGGTPVTSSYYQSYHEADTTQGVYHVFG